MVANGIDEIASLPNGRTFSGHSGAQPRIVCNVDANSVDARSLDLVLASVPPRQFNWRQSVIAWAFQNIGGFVDTCCRQSSGSPVNIVLNRWLGRIEGEFRRYS